MQFTGMELNLVSRLQTSLNTGGAIWKAVVYSNKNLKAVKSVPGQFCEVLEQIRVCV